MSEITKYDKELVRKFLQMKREMLIELRAKGEVIEKDTNPLAGVLGAMTTRLADELIDVWHIFGLSIESIFELTEAVGGILPQLSTLAAKSGDKNLRQEIETLKQKWAAYEPTLEILNQYIAEYQKRNKETKESYVA